ncbi:MAG: hypothetical protein KAI79_16230 [Bacteroidales bacterium]|nr:hypothetical protein [Bacteroidales bacterium]
MQFKYYIYIILSTFLATFSCQKISYEDQQKQSFIKFFGNSDLDEAGDVIIAQNGDYIICGAIKLNESEEDIWIARVDINGNTIWENTIKDTLSQFPKSIIETNNGEIFISASTQKNIQGINYDLLEVAKFSESGILIDTSFFPHNYSYIPKDMVYLPDSNIYIIGNKQQDDSYILQAPFDIFLFNINTNLDSLWFRTYGGIENDEASQISKSEDNTLDIIGSTSSFAEYNQALSNILVFKTDSNGILKDKITLGGLNNDYGTSLCKTNTGNYVISGYTKMYSKNILYSAEISLFSHEIIWQKNYEMSYGIIPLKIINDNENFISVGQADFIGNTDIFLSKLDNNGDSLWFKTIGTEGSESALSSTVSQVGGYLIIATSEFKGNQIITLLKVSPNGDFLNY